MFFATISEGKRFNISALTGFEDAVLDRQLNGTEVWPTYISTDHSNVGRGKSEQYSFGNQRDVDAIGHMATEQLYWNGMFKEE